MIEHLISLTYSHRVFFTEDVFAGTNSTLEQAFSEPRTARVPRIFFVVDAGLLQKMPALPDLVKGWFATRSGQFELRGAPLVIDGGEACKNDWTRVEKLWHEMNERGMDRHSYVAVVGGGAVLDLVGFAAATAHRGIRLVRLPTTTLSQADGGVGVKNGVNYFSKKNWVGTFAVPHAVVNDLSFLHFQQPDDMRAGFIEAVKVALIRDANFYHELEKNAPRLAAFESEPLRLLVERSAALHVRHIATGGDPFELGSARPLDFGHWIAHKLEQIANFHVSHGAAVAIGMTADLLYAVGAGLLGRSECDRILRLIQQLGFHLWHEGLLDMDQSGKLKILRGLEEFREHLGGELCITLVTGIGRAVEVHEMDERLVLAALQEMRERFA